MLVANPRARANHHHAGFLERWWQLSWPRHEMLQVIRALPRYFACGQVTKRPVFEFIDPSINPNAALVVFPYADDYSFGVLQSTVHWVSILHPAKRGETRVVTMDGAEAIALHQESGRSRLVSSPTSSCSTATR